MEARALVAEVNAHIPPSEARTVPYSGSAQWDGTTYGGASVLAIAKLLERHAYSLVYCESHGVNCFFIRNDVLGLESAPLRTLDTYFSVTSLHRPPNFFGEGRRHPDANGAAREWVWV